MNKDIDEDICKGVESYIVKYYVHSLIEYGMSKDYNKLDKCVYDKDVDVLNIYDF
jgi:hypothetical protein